MWPTALARRVRRLPGSRLPDRRTRNAAGALGVINGVLAGIGSVYLTTHSAWVTLLAAISAVFLGALALITANERL